MQTTVECRFYLFRTREIHGRQSTSKLHQRAFDFTDALVTSNNVYSDQMKTESKGCGVVGVQLKFTGLTLADGMVNLYS